MPAFVAVCDLLYRRGLSGATALLGVDGTAHGVRQRSSFVGRNAEVPMMIIAVGAGEQIAAVLPDLAAGAAPAAAHARAGPLVQARRAAAGAIDLAPVPPASPHSPSGRSR